MESAKRMSKQQTILVTGGAGYIGSHAVLALKDAGWEVAVIDDLSNGRLVLGLGAGWQRREHENYGIPFDDFPTRFNKLTDALEITRRLLRDAKPVSYTGKIVSVRDAVLLPRPNRKTPILIGGNGPMRSLPLAARYADEWNAVYLDVDTFRARNNRLDELLEKNGRDPRSVKRSLMGPFGWAEGAQGIERLETYIEAGCQRFMLQFTDYDNLEPIEAWAADNLKRFR